MADCHDLFGKYHENISLPSGKREYLVSARNALRKLIRRHFKDVLKLKAPKFYGQGSYAMKTMISPLNGEFDIDDGVYLEHLSDTEDTDWPTPATVHSWIITAMEGHTKSKPTDKNTCVRISYAGDYHVDLPSYAELLNMYRLADKAKGWVKSDSKALTDWFLCQLKLQGEQLRHLVRYFKAWSDYQKQKHGKIANGLLLTVLAEENFVSSDRDDESFTKTIENMRNRIATSFVVNNPVDPTENLGKRLTDGQKTQFRERIGALADCAGQALKTESRDAASKLWREELGSRFPFADEDDQNEVVPIWVKSGNEPPSDPVNKKGGGRNA